MIIKTRGIVLRSMKYSETSIIVDVYTELKGLRTYIISGVRKRNSQVPAGLLQVLSLVDLVVYFREGKSMNRIKEIKAAHIYEKVPFDVFRSAVGMFIIELTRKTIRESEENEDLFLYLYNTLVVLDQSEFPINNIHLTFMIGLSAFLGFQPTLNDFGENSFFDLQEGVFGDDEPTHHHFLEQENNTFFKKFLHTSVEDCHNIKMSRAERKSLLENMITYYKLHLENFKDLNTHSILERILSE